MTSLFLIGVYLINFFKNITLSLILQNTFEQNIVACSTTTKLSRKFGSQKYLQTYIKII